MELTSEQSRNAAKLLEQVFEILWKENIMNTPRGDTRRVAELRELLPMPRRNYEVQVLVKYSVENCTTESDAERQAEEEIETHLQGDPFYQGCEAMKSAVTD